MLINLVLREIRNHKYAFHIETLLIVRHVFSTFKSFNLRIWPSKAIYFKHSVFIVFDSVVYLLFMLSFFISWDLLKYKSQLIMV